MKTKLNVDKICRIVGIIIYPIILFLIGFMLGAKDEITLREGPCSYLFWFMIAFLILFQSIILKRIPHNKK